MIGSTPKINQAICYVDALNLYYGIRDLNKPYKWLDIQALAESFLAPDTRLKAVKYFTSNLKGEENKRYRQHQYLKALRCHCDKLEIIYGYFAEKHNLCRHCGKKTSTYEEKKTDVNIACELLEDARNNLFDIAFLVSGDSDLVSAVERTIKKGKVVIVASPPRRKSVELREKATGHFDINKTRLKNCLLPNIVKTPEGDATCPQSWMGEF